MEREVFGGVEEDYEECGYGGCRRSRHDDYYEDTIGGGHRRIVDAFERSLKLKRLVDVGGNEIATNLPIDEESILGEDPYGDREPDEEYFTGFTGNEGANATHWYRDTVSCTTRSHHRSIDAVAGDGICPQRAVHVIPTRKL